LLIIVSAVQAVELVGLKGKLSGDLSSLGASVASTGGKKVSVGSGTAGGASGGSLKKNLKNLPTMVGGC